MASFRWEAPRLCDVELEELALAKAFQHVAINESMLKVLSKGEGFTSVVGNMTKKMGELLAGYLQKPDTLPAIVVVALEAVQMVMAGLSFVVGQPSARESDFEAMMVSKAAPASITRQLLNQSAFWSTASKLAKQQAVASKTLMPEVSDVRARLEKHEFTLDELPNICKRLIVWKEGLRPGLPYGNNHALSRAVLELQPLLKLSAPLGFFLASRLQNLGKEGTTL